MTTVFAKYGSQRNVGAILCARIDCDHSPRTRDAIREKPPCSYEALQVLLIRCRLPAFRPRHSKAARAMTLAPHEYRPQCSATVAARSVLSFSRERVIGMCDLRIAVDVVSSFSVTSRVMIRTLSFAHLTDTFTRAATAVRKCPRRQSPIRLVNCALTTVETASVSADATLATSNAPPSRPPVSIASIKLAHSCAPDATESELRNGSPSRARCAASPPVVRMLNASTIAFVRVAFSSDVVCLQSRDWTARMAF